MAPATAKFVPGSGASALRFALTRNGLRVSYLSRYFSGKLRLHPADFLCSDRLLEPENGCVEQEADG
jgi:hypothetical protein